MIRQRLAVAVFILPMALSSCAHHRNVMVGSDGVHRVTATGTTPANADRNAIVQAEHFCKQMDLNPAFKHNDPAEDNDDDDATSPDHHTPIVGKIGISGGTGLGTRHGAFYGGGIGFGRPLLRSSYSSDLRFICQ